MSRLRSGEVCPIHRNTTCCGRTDFRKAQASKKRGLFVLVRPGVYRAPDGREKCSPGELRRRKNQLLNTNPVCAACDRKFTDYSEVELAHKQAKGMGGAKHDSRWENLVLMHKDENREQGSRDLETYLADPNRIALKSKKEITTP